MSQPPASSQQSAPIKSAKSSSHQPVPAKSTKTSASPKPPISSKFVKLVPKNTTSGTTTNSDKNAKEPIVVEGVYDESGYTGSGQPIYDQETMARIVRDLEREWDEWKGLK